MGVSMASSRPCFVRELSPPEGGGGGGGGDPHYSHVLGYSTPNEVVADDAEMEKEDDQFGHKLSNKRQFPTAHVG